MWSTRTDTYLGRNWIRRCGPLHMAQYFLIHPTHPQHRLIEQAADIVRTGGLLVYPTDSCYALGCRLGDKDAMERIRSIRQVDSTHHFTLVCRNLSEISRYARVDNRVYRLLKASTPGSYTFILQATRDVPRRLQNPQRKTIGLRVPNHPVAQALLAELDEPLLSSTLLLPSDDLPLNDAREIRRRLEHQVELVMDAGSCGIEMTTVVDLTQPEPEVVRAGKGSTAPFGVNVA
jgi:tRNA threonylcarbamoyl adenosine modification protein (Sua5/YciO/YrdC/YwlC family)